MILPYVYKAVHNKTNQYYFGFRCANKVPASEDIGTIYHSSSKIVKKDFKNYTFEVIAEFFNSKEAFKFEQELIISNWNDPLLLNKCYQLENSKVFKIFGSKSKEQITKMKIARNKNPKRPGAAKHLPHGYGKDNPFYGKHHSKNTRKHLSLKALTRPRVSCIYCKIEASISNFTKYHGAKCNYNPNRIPDIECSCIKCKQSVLVSNLSRHIKSKNCDILQIVRTPKNVKVECELCGKVVSKYKLAYHKAHKHHMLAPK